MLTPQLVQPPVLDEQTHWQPVVAWQMFSQPGSHTDTLVAPPLLPCPASGAFWFEESLLPQPVSAATTDMNTAEKAPEECIAAIHSHANHQDHSQTSIPIAVELVCAVWS